MKQIVLEKLEWPLLISQLSSLARTVEGRERCAELTPHLNRDSIYSRWEKVEPLRNLHEGGYTPPIGEVINLRAIFRAASMGQVLGGEELRQVFDLLLAIKQTHKFCSDFGGKCRTLETFKTRTYTLPQLAQSIEKTIAPDGTLHDDASPTLMAIRKNKTGLRSRIEQKIRQLLRDAEMEKYIQDDFFTVRAERYVVPIRLDGHGRIKGSIYDTSDSGQTLFIEPSAIAPLNEELLELELTEKLEILKIFRTLWEGVKAELPTLTANYDELVELDTQCAEAQLAKSLGAGRVNIVDKPTLKLVKAKHPLVRTKDGSLAIPSNIELVDGQNILIVSGPNAGGKTVVLKTVGMLHLMVSAGLLVPAGEESEVYLFKEIFLELGDAQNITANLSTFSGHILNIRPAVTESSKDHLVLLDEIAAGTEPQAGSALAQAIIEELARRGPTTVVTTHFDRLKGLAITDKRLRNGSMEYSVATYRPTYKLVLDVPGQSYGIELAEQMGLPANLTKRAKELRGKGVQQLDEIISELSLAKQQVSEQKVELEKQHILLQERQSHWEREREALKEARKKAATELTSHYEDMLVNLRREYDETLGELRKQLKRLEEKGDASGAHDSDSAREEFLRNKQRADAQYGKLQQTIAGLGKVGTDEIPGEPVDFASLHVGDMVYHVNLRQQGQIVRVGRDAKEPVDVQIGLINSRVAIADLRRLKPKDAERRNQNKPSNQRNQRATPSNGAKDEEIKLTIQTSTNSLDVRGQDTDQALAATWKFIDAALLRGEGRLVVIHGHGFNKLKNAIRDALTNNCPYKLRFRSGLDGEGGDGVTVLALDQ